MIRIFLAFVLTFASPTAASAVGQSLRPPAVVEPAVSEPRTDPARDAGRTAVFVVGDSTVKDHGPGEGWGDWLAPFFDERRIQIVNWAMGGLSSRAFLEKGRWQKALAQMKPRDFVLIQFGDHDQRDLRQYARDARGKGASPIFMSPVPRNV